MHIDHTHRKWLTASLIILGIATAVYIPYAVRSPAGPRGGSPIGLAFGIIGSAFMVFAGLLAWRKKVPIMRIGRAQAWMRGHLWLGLLSLPIILFHAGFHFGGTLTSVLMALLITVVASGIFGAILQNYLPNVMTVEVPSETIFDQIDHVRGQLIADADGLVAGAVSAASSEKEAAPLTSFYQRELRPFLEGHVARQQLLANRGRARTAFEGLRVMVPAGLQEATNKLEHISEEARQLRLQTRLHHWLHGWLMMHIPLSFALLLLGCVHAIMALHY